MTSEQFAILLALVFSIVSAAAFGVVAGRLKAKRVVDEDGMIFSKAYM